MDKVKCGLFLLPGDRWLKTLSNGVGSNSPNYDFPPNHKHAHMHATLARIHVRACPYLVSESGIGAERQQLRHDALQPAAACIMQRRVPEGIL